MFVPVHSANKTPSGHLGVQTCLPTITKASLCAEALSLLQSLSL